MPVEWFLIGNDNCTVEGGSRKVVALSTIDASEVGQSSAVTDLDRVSKILDNITMHLLTTITSLLCILLASISTAEAQDGQQPLQDSASKPNILFILTDDQDLHMDSLSYMPYLKEHIIDRGLSFNRHYCTVALCCPSRVSMWTGLAARK